MYEVQARASQKQSRDANNNSCVGLETPYFLSSSHFLTFDDTKKAFPHIHILESVGQEKLVSTQLPRRYPTRVVKGLSNLHEGG